MGHRPNQTHKKITVRMTCAVKHDQRHKSRLVAGGHLTNTPTDSTHSSVVSLRGIRMVVFLAELNDLEVCATDVGNAHLEAITKELVCTTAGPQFGERAGHTLIIIRALHRLKSSDLRWRQRFRKVPREMGFMPSKAE